MYKKFYNFGLSDEVLKSLSDMGFEEPTPIQEIALPPALEGLDIIGKAQTGTGKTTAFGVPIVEKCVRGNKLPFAIVLAPTRELAVQVAQEINNIGKLKGIKALPVYGGQSIDIQMRSLKKGVDVIVGTPGRVKDHIKRKTLVLKQIQMLVLDEADEMLNMGFIEDIESILETVPSERQTLLFSATMPPAILKIAKKYMHDPKIVAVDADKMVVPKIKQIFYDVRHDDKIKALTRLLDVEEPNLTLVFCHTKREVDDVYGKLRQMGYYAGAIHGDYTQSHRDEMLNKFKKGEVDILIATDVAARGLDIPDVSHVINFSIPQHTDSYIHRIGRTARAGKSGIAITFVTPREYRQLKLIERSAKTKITKAILPTRAEVMKIREQEVLSEVDAMYEENKHHDYMHLVEELSQKYTLQEIAASALGLIFSEIDVEEIEEVGMTSQSSSAGFTRLFITVGRRDEVKVADIVRAIAEGAGISGKKIGNIALFDKFSFVEIPANLVSKVVEGVDNTTLNGRKIRIQPARARNAGSGQNKSGGRKR
ncbi:MAG: DEAD/DEAH box helicase [Nitrospira sp.]|nr:DEAD/DEAH box helicase [bacterium]MBL7049230.1 DEAD/DEAH box helicase [Nitrospira sp.]